MMKPHHVSHVVAQIIVSESDKWLKIIPADLWSVAYTKAHQAYVGVP